MKYKIGDKATVIDDTGSHRFEIGQVVRFKGGRDNDEWEYLDGSDFWYIDPETAEDDLEPVEKPAADLNLSVDIPTLDMKEFADHCERAAAALERIKDILA